jgi:D-3-phosphoglycerate dehydrogenase
MEASCRSGSIFVATDVFNEEPSGGEGEFSSSLCDCPNMYITHHIGASTEQAQNAVAEETVRIVREYVMTGSAPNVVNVMTSGSPATHVLVVRHQDKVGVLAHVLDVLKSENASVQEMENIVLGGAHAAIAQIAIDKELSSSALTTIRAQGSIFDASLIPVSGSKN